MPKLTVFAIALLLSTLTASVANAQAGKSKHQSRVTPEEGQFVVDIFYHFLGNAVDPKAGHLIYDDEERKNWGRKRRPRHRQPHKRSDNNLSKEDASVAGGGD